MVIIYVPKPARLLPSPRFRDEISKVSGRNLQGFGTQIILFIWTLSPTEFIWVRPKSNAKVDGATPQRIFPPQYNICLQLREAVQKKKWYWKALPMVLEEKNISRRKNSSDSLRFPLCMEVYILYVESTVYGLAQILELRHLCHRQHAGDRWLNSTSSRYVEPSVSLIFWAGLPL